MHCGARLLGGLRDNRCELPAKRIGQADMGGQSLAKETYSAAGWCDR